MRNTTQVSGMERESPPMPRMSRVPTEWITAPAARKSSALNAEWLRRWNWLWKTAPAPMAYTMKPSWLTVDHASTRFRSLDTVAIEAAMNAEIMPTRSTERLQPGTGLKAGAKRARR